MTGDRPGSLSDDYFVDYCEIDKQHTEIYAQLALLSAEYLDSGELPVAGFLHLFQLVEQHFAAEEELAAQAAIPFSEHTKVHHDNLEQMRDTFDIVQSGLSDPMALIRYVDFWFLHHIVLFDKPFVLSLKAAASHQVVK